MKKKKHTQSARRIKYMCIYGQKIQKRACWMMMMMMTVLRRLETVEKTQAANWCTHYISIAAIQIEGEITDFMVRVHIRPIPMHRSRCTVKCSVMKSHSLCRMTIEKTRYQIISFRTFFMQLEKYQYHCSGQSQHWQSLIAFVCFDSTAKARSHSVQVQYATSAHQNVWFSHFKFRSVYFT